MKKFEIQYTQVFEVEAETEEEALDYFYENQSMIREVNSFIDIEEEDDDE